ncbi:acylphosphatase [Duganella sp. FT109W]|uniref:acylphosphatase n=1 Tax=Duganella margarita TaxID=2692170 RepID=A0A7X4H0D3_9BURK|nr:acylphosphatase [Duganella margarita]MYM72975.1 acylphosphatase [Duganella margarita]MYN40817.1 acylphosphatase [Duganella margarita]
MAKHLLITGLVQGVGYRASFARQAVDLGLRGWVRNLSDGSVEAEIAGDDAAIETIINWSHQGPPAARVDNVTVEDTATTHDAFRILLA